MWSSLSRRPALGIGLALLALIGGGWLAAQSEKPDLADSARQFLDSLSESQRAKTVLEYGSPHRVQWHFVPKQERRGLPIAEMSNPQRALARRLLRAVLSEVGYDKATKIMELERILNVLERTRPAWFRDPERYFFALYGAPEPQARWQLSIEGHHLSLNFVVDQGKIVSHTPAFFGANPAEVKSEVGAGPKKGARVLAKEETLAFELLASLTPEQAQRAVIAAQALGDIRAGGEPQPPQTEPAGLALGAMNSKQQEMLLALVGVYTGNMPRAVSEREWQAIHSAGTEKIHFAWAGAKTPNVGHYYRIQGPTFVVELCNTQPDAAGNPANHVHTVYRRLNGDFGAANPPARSGG